MLQFTLQEWTDSSASMHSIIGCGKGKPYVLAKKQTGLFIKISEIKNGDRQMFCKGHCLSFKRSPSVLYFSMFYKLIVCFAITYFLPYLPPIYILMCCGCGTFLRV